MTIKIYDHIELKQISEIKPYWRNPRKNDKTVEALIKVIPVVGFNVPIYIDGDGVIIKGHARYRAATRLGMTQIPCIISENNEEQNRLDRIADNKMSELAEWDIPELRYELEQIDFPLDEIGFDMPKADFMEDMYSQDDFKPITPEQMNKAKQNIVENNNSFVDNDKQSVWDMEVNNSVEQEKTEMRKYVKAKCPKCGEEIVLYL